MASLSSRSPLPGGSTCSLAVTRSNFAPFRPVARSRRAAPAHGAGAPAATPPQRNDHRDAHNVPSAGGFMAHHGALAVLHACCAAVLTYGTLTATPPPPAQAAEASSSLERQACNVGDASTVSTSGSSSSSSSSTLNPLAELSGLFDFGGGEERDPIEPFTLYGTSFKKYLIEQLDGEKVVARKRGFTVDACAGALPASAETPEFQGLPTGEKARFARNRTCAKAEGSDLKAACGAACGGACGPTVASYAEDIVARTGLRLLDKDRERLERSCSRNCAYECSKPGKAFDFVVPFRKGAAQ